MKTHKNTIRSLACVASAVAALLLLLPAASAIARTQLNLMSHFGGKVNLDGANVCLVTEACQPGLLGGGAGWFGGGPQSLAVDETTHDVYVADGPDERIEELGPDGEFLLTWGWKVNRNGGNICTEVEASECQAGEAGTGLAEQINDASGIAVDQGTQNVYVEDLFNHRIDEFEPDGKFVLMFGGDVNTNGTNVCIAAEAAKCRIGVEGTADGFFAFPQFFGSLIAVGGPGHLVYVAGQARVQEFSGSGTYVGQLSLTPSTAPPFPALGQVTGLTVSGSGDVYVTESHSVSVNQAENTPSGVHKFNASGVQVAEFDRSSSVIRDMTLDGSGRLSLIDEEPSPTHGTLYSLTGAPVSRFGEGTVSNDLAYNDATGELYAAFAQNEHHEVNVFGPVITPEVITGGASAVQATSSTLEGEADAEESPQTTPPRLLARSFFEYGRCGPGPAPNTCTGHAYGQTVTTTPNEETGVVTVPVEAQTEGLYPNQLYHYRLAASDSNGTSEGEAGEFTTKPLPPVVQVPQAPFVRGESAVLSGSLNPENAATRYHFEYGPCESLASCAHATPDMESAVHYGEVGVVQEEIGLLPSTIYHFRLVATNEHGETSEGPESTFTTGPPVTVRAITGAANAITATSALISGTVDPDGEPATYSFELGAYDGPGTHFGVVLSGPAGAGSAPLEKTLALSGLQPGTEYAYRITVKSGYGEATGAVATFTTGGLPSVLALPTPLAILALPPISFPVAANVSSRTVSCRAGYKLDQAGKCTKAKVKKKAKRRAKSKKKGRKSNGHG